MVSKAAQKVQQCEKASQKVKQYQKAAHNSSKVIEGSVQRCLRCAHNMPNIHNILWQGQIVSLAQSSPRWYTQYGAGV